MSTSSPCGFTTPRLERLRAGLPPQPLPPAESLGTLVGQAAAVLFRFRLAAVVACRQALHQPEAQ